MMDEKICEEKFDDSCCEAPCVRDSHELPKLGRLTKEERLKKYEEYLQNDLKNELEDIEISEAKREIFKKFKKEHESEYQKIENHRKSRRLRSKLELEDNDDDKVKIPQEEIDRMLHKYVELENRQSEILRIATTKEELKKVPIDQMNAMIDEYMASEKLKLILVDRLRGIFDNRRINLACETFSGSSLKFAD